ncbi:MAG: hypothetical protein AAB521_04915 [Patescibacteria group bacterium]
MDSKINKEAFKSFIPFVVATTLICGLIYVSVQQVLRQTANDPQIQIAEDVSGALSTGVPPQAIANPNGTDLKKSLATFIIIYDSSKSAVLSSATLDGKTPELPKGVFDEVGKKGQRSFTWEPKKGTRVAAVVQKYSGKSSGYVLVGRSIREIEKRELMLEQGMGIAWIVILIATYVSIYILNQRMSKVKTIRRITSK